MTFKDYLKAHYTEQEIAAMSKEGLACRRVQFDNAQAQKSGYWDDEHYRSEMQAAYSDGRL